MNKRKRLRISAVVLSIILILSTMLPSSQTVQAKKGAKDAEEILNNLTDAQRNALNELETERGFTIQPGINLESPDPVKVIIEFKQDPAKVAVAKAKANKKRSKVTLSEAKKQVEESHKQFKKELQNLMKTKKSNENTSETEITQAFRDAFNGVAMTLPGNAVEDLLRTGVVKRVWKDEEVQLDLPETKEKKAEPKMADSIPQIGVDKLHDEGIEGEGINVGVIDTGIDYNHPDLKNAYAGYRAIDGEDPSALDPDSVKGWDYVENDADPMETTYKKWQESDQPEFDYYGNSYYTSHGTHVSGTVAGQKKNNADYAVKGIAPAVDLYNYRVLGPYGSGQTAWVLAGIDKAVKDKMDVINLSLGMDVNDPLSPTSVAVNNAMLSDVVAVVASGNAGPEEQTVGSPGSAALAISVGASDVSQNIPTFAAASDEEQFTDVKLLAKNFTDDLVDLQDQTFSVVDAGIGTIGDFEGKDVTDKIAVIERGDIAFDEKVRNAKDAGAKAAIIYNNEAGQIPFYIGESTAYLPAFRLSKEDGDKLITGLSEETVFTFGELGNTKSVGDHLADFSSRGPVAQTYDIKPDVVAPGVAIFSTVPFYMNGSEGDNYESAYARMQGTSMASPHVAGTAALILQENPDYTAFDVKAALMNTAVDLQEDYSVYEVGAGRINAYDAVHADSSIKILDQTEMLEGEESVLIDVETGSLAFGSHYLAEGEGLEDSRKVVIENRSSAENSYKFEVEFLKAEENRQDADENGVVVNVPESVTVSAGKTEETEPMISVPATAEYGTYEGYIQVVNQNDAEEGYQIPFAIRVTSKGIDYVVVNPPAISSDSTPTVFIMVNFKLRSGMKTIDVIAKDEKTGKPVGFVGTMDASGIKPDSELGMLFNGKVYPFTNDPSKPISDKLTDLPEGNYQLEMIGYDANGDTYKKDDTFVVDNTPPKMTFKDLKPGIHEVDDSMYSNEDGERAVWVHANIYDSTIDVLKSFGKDYDQSANTLFYLQDSMMFPGQIPIDANGDTKFGIPPEEIADGPTTVYLTAIDLASGTMARIRHDDKYTFIKKGSDYGTPTYDKDKVRLGDTLTMTLSLNNVKKLFRGTFGVEYEEDLYKFVDIKANEALIEYANKNGVEINLDEPEINKGKFNTNSVKVGASLDSDAFKGLDGDMPFLDVTFKVIGDEYYIEPAHLNVQDLSYEKVASDQAVTIPVLSRSSERFKLIPKHSLVKGYIFPEAFMEDGHLSYGTDFTSIGAQVYVEAPNGKKYTGTIDKNGRYSINGIPAIKDDYKLLVKVPGHLTSINSINLSKKVDGERVGIYVSNYKPEMNLAGDITGDNMIDIHDVMRAVAHYGKENNKADINKDGIVDETDIRFIENNFLKVGPEVKGNKQPKEKLGKKGLNDFLQALGLEPVDG